MLQLLTTTSIVKYAFKLNVWKAFTPVHNPKLSSANILALNVFLHVYNTDVYVVVDDDAFDDVDDIYHVNDDGDVMLFLPMMIVMLLLPMVMVMCEDKEALAALVPAREDPRLSEWPEPFHNLT